MGGMKKIWKRSVHPTIVPYILFGDFNEILRGDEKDGGAIRSDHDMEAFRRCVQDCNILLSTSSSFREDFRDKPFRFESYWLSNDGCKQIVFDAWNATMGDRVDVKLEHYSNALKEWAKKSFGEIRGMIKLIERKLAKAQKLYPNAAAIEACKSMALELDDLHGMEDAY